MTMIHLYRNKCQNNNWCDLLQLNLNHEHFNNMEGVYIIRHGGPNSRVVRVGQGIIKDRLSEHRENKDILRYQNLGLFVTWASVNAQYRDGVEKYLGDTLKPLVGERFPECSPIVVNLPR